MLFVASRRGALVIMPWPFHLQKAEYQTFILRYRLFLYYTVDELCSGGFQSKKSKKTSSLAGIWTHTTRGKKFSCQILYHWAIEASNWIKQNLDFKWIYAETEIDIDGFPL